MCLLRQLLIHSHAVLCVSQNSPALVLSDGPRQSDDAAVAAAGDIHVQMAFAG